MSRHYAVWMDHKEAKLFHITADTWDEAKVHAPSAHVNRHERASLGAKEHPEDLNVFYREVSKALHDADEILVLGPGVAKLQFIKYAHKHDHALEPKIVGVETVDHPSDRQVVAFARKYFKAEDRMH